MRHLNVKKKLIALRSASNPCWWRVFPRRGWRPMDIVYFEDTHRWWTVHW